ncbi:Pentatricopeptide repeat-containing protein [Camellia lanceoleosa]|uniref:Pentatricopeptide repeat-containing protein n=1 Tax=Camellia lanceoleosa TaxID=1840588 RepID=A0ACC0J5B0_9ERIC|nr:Pentatricopeptide repeat-containing protein [Camellia lanceoleosa]
MKTKATAIDWHQPTSSRDNVDKLVEKDEIREVDFEQLESVLSLLQSTSSSTSASVDGSLESSLDAMDLTLNQEFVIRVLETLLVPGDNLIAFFKWASKKPEFSENGVLNEEILNELICFFSKLGKGKAGFEVFNMFGEFGCVADAETYYFTIEALSWTIDLIFLIRSSGVSHKRPAASNRRRARQTEPEPVEVNVPVEEDDHVDANNDYVDDDIVVKDDDVDNDIGVGADLIEDDIGVDDNNTEPVPGAPEDPSLLISFRNHVVSAVWKKKTLREQLDMLRANEVLQIGPCVPDAVLPTPLTDAFPLALASQGIVGCV